MHIYNNHFFEVSINDATSHYIKVENPHTLAIRMRQTINQ